MPHSPMPRIKNIPTFDGDEKAKATDFANWMTQEKGVAVIPLSPFYKDPPQSTVVRFCFAKQDETLKQAADIINAI